MTHHDGGPAFPHHHCSYFGTGDDPSGMSLRDWFAGMALQGLLACPYDAPWKEDSQKVSTSAYEMADAMLKQREQA